MIRRAWPKHGDTRADHWLLITQPEHARISWQLASAWGNETCNPLICPDDQSHPLYRVREELLLAIREHDAGWVGYAEKAAIDQAAGRPLQLYGNATRDGPTTLG